MDRKRNKSKLIICAVILFLLAAAVISGWGKLPAFADTTEYTSVTEDLSKDASFKKTDYPYVTEDYSIKVIQIAESTAGELFVYTYQPSQLTKYLIVTSINMSLSEEAAGTRLYGLTLLSMNGVFGKYKVNGFTVRADVRRYYNITSIYRAWDKLIDSAGSDGNTVTEVAYEVGSLWTAVTESGGVKYYRTDKEVITVTDKVVGYVNYSDGTELGWGVTSGATSAHFVAFSTDKPMDKLMQADLTFNEREVSAKVCANPLHLNHKLGQKFDYRYGEKVEHDPNPLTITYTQKGSNAGGGNIKPSNKYSWDRIVKSTDFLSGHSDGKYEITSESASSISKTQWVLNFYETPLSAQVNGVWLPLVSIITMPFTGDGDIKYTEVSDVTILRLTFETDGIVYDLGAVDNRQTGSDKPINKPEIPAQGILEPLLDLIKKMPWWGWAIVAVVILAILLPVLSLVFPVIGQVIKLVFKGIVLLIKGLVWIICLPFKGIGLLINKISGKDKNNADKKRKRKTEKTDG